MSALILLILILATWRVSSLLVHEPGPFDMFGKLRHVAGVRYDEYSEPQPTNELAKLFTCIWCMSFWVGLIVGILYLYFPVAVSFGCFPLAIGAGAVLMDGIRSYG